MWFSKAYCIILIPSVSKLPTCSKHCCKTSCTQWTPQELWMSCGIWRQDIRSRSFKSSSCEVGPPWIRPSNRCSVRLRSGEWGTLPAEKGQFHKETPLQWRGVCGLQQSLDRWCQYNIPMNASTQGFPAEHCPEHYTAFADVPSSHTASSCHFQ